jgi:hypothetical protein
MTAPRGKVSASLAARGRPEDWANEQESACLLGLESDKYYSLLPQMEANGFPKKTSWNNKRFIPAIDEFRRRWLAGDFRVEEKTEPEPDQKIRRIHGRGQRTQDWTA